MSLSHQQIHTILHGTDSLDPATQAALHAHLEVCPECRAYAQSLAETRESLAGLRPQETLSESEKKHMAAAIQSLSRRHAMKRTISGLTRTLAWGATAAILVLAVSWSIHTLLPVTPGAQPTPSSAAPGDTPAGTPAATERIANPPTGVPPAGTPQPTETPLPGSARVGLFPNLQFTFATGMPAAPAELTLYQQVLPEGVTVESASQAAAALGLDGAVYASAGEVPDQRLYTVSDGMSELRFINFPSQFVYQLGSTTPPVWNGPMLPFEERVRIAEDFLRSRNLLTAPYRVEDIEGEQGGVRFRQLLDGRPVLYGIGMNRTLSSLEWIDVSVSGDGQVTLVSHSAHTFQPAGPFPILSAQAAWERLSAPNANTHSLFAVLAEREPFALQSWTPSYPDGQALDLYGYAVIYQPAQPGGQPLVTFNNYTLSGYTTGIEMGKFLHLWGQFETGPDGKRTFNVAGWDLSNRVDDYITGPLHRQGEKALVTTEDGRTIEVAGLPAEIPDGAQVTILGATGSSTGHPVTEWRSITTGDFVYSYGYHLSCGGGGGGGGGGSGPIDANFGGGSLALVNPDGSLQTTPTPPPSMGPYSAGTELDGVIGHLNITLEKYPDGHTIRQIQAWVADDQAKIYSQGTYPFKLEGAVDGIEKLHNLPLKLWGRVDRFENGAPVAVVERYEAIYPGLKVQAFLGTQSDVLVDGQPALLFTAEDGQTYLMADSLNCGEMCRTGQAGDRVILEGIVYPDQTLNGYPVMRTYGSAVAGPGENLSTYVVASAQPYEMDAMLNADLAYTVSGSVTIDSIELAYMANSTNRCTPGAVSPEESFWLAVQPVWVYTGHFEDGRRFEIQVQALPDQYLR